MIGDLVQIPSRSEPIIILYQKPRSPAVIRAGRKRMIEYKPAAGTDIDLIEIRPGGSYRDRQLNSWVLTESSRQAVTRLMRHGKTASSECGQH